MDNFNKDDFVLLTTVGDIEFESTGKILHDAKIPFDYKNDPLHPYDYNVSYRKIFVPESLLLRAKDVLGISNELTENIQKDELVSRSKNPIFIFLRVALALILLTPIIFFLISILIKIGIL